jgi:hypothetical protein
MIEKWIFKQNVKAVGSLVRYKTCWILRMFTQRPDLDYDQIFNLVVKSTTIYTVLTLAPSRGWLIHHLDVNNVFVHDTHTKTVYCIQSINFVGLTHLHLMYQLNKSL